MRIVGFVRPMLCGRLAMQRPIVGVIFLDGDGVVVGVLLKSKLACQCFVCGVGVLCTVKDVVAGVIYEDGTACVALFFSTEG